MAGNSTLSGSHPTPEKIQRMKEFLYGLKEEANKAHDAKDTWTLGIYSELVRKVSPVIQRAEARLDRESLAKINKAHKSLRKAEREAVKEEADAVKESTAG